MKTPKLKFTQEIKDGWLNALRSGKYRQGVGQLRNIEKSRTTYCCLGVLAEIHPLIGLEDDGHNCKNYRAMTSYVPLNELIGEDVVNSLANINDSQCDGVYTSVIPIIERLSVLQP